ncbi:MAG TPA: hypothetical protein VMB52_03975 [Verrucomicrobiae bacterium]|nr:hypothetical protein [Verrucomicrobiae bacterium]
MKFDNEQRNSVRRVLGELGIGMTAQSIHGLMLNPHSGTLAERGLRRLIDDKGFAHPVRIMQMGPLLPDRQADINWDDASGVLIPDYEQGEVSTNYLELVALLGQPAPTPETAIAPPSPE